MVGEPAKEVPMAAMLYLLKLRCLEGLNCPGSALCPTWGHCWCSAGPPSSHPCMWRLCEENSMASGAFTYPEVLALWLEGDRLALGISLCNFGQGMSPLWACLCPCMNKGAEGMCANHLRWEE